MKKQIMTLLLITLIFPIKVNAFTGDVRIECNNSVISLANNLSCTIKGNNFSDKISSFHAKLSLDNNLTLENIEKDTSWEGSAESGIIDLYTDENKSGNINFASFVIKLDNENSNINTNIVLEDIKIGDSQFMEHNINDASVTIKVISNNGSTNDDKNDENDNKNEDINSDNENNSNIDDNIDNPETGDMKISMIVLLILVVITVMIINMKKLWSTK